MNIDNLVSFLESLDGKKPLGKHLPTILEYIMNTESKKDVVKATFDQGDQSCIHQIRKRDDSLDSTEQRQREKKVGFKVRSRGESERGQKVSPVIKDR